MQPTYTPPVPVIGNHPAGCSCSTCEGGRKRLLASPYVKSLIANLTTYHSLLYTATKNRSNALPCDLEKRVLTLTDDLSDAKQGAQVLQNALNESRKISQEREKQLAEEKRLLNLSRMSDANARGLLQQIRDEIGGDQDEPALEKVRRMKDEVISRGVACEWNAAEVVRLAESLRDSQEAALALQQDLTASQESHRLAEQGRDAAIESRDRFRDDLVAANNRERVLEKDRNSQNVAIDQLTNGYEEQVAQRLIAEKRYMALKRQRAGEWLITIAFFVLAVIPGMFAAVRYWGLK